MKFSSRTTPVSVFHLFHFHIVVPIVFILLTGCAFTSRDTLIYHAFDYPSPSKIQETNSAIPETLMIYKFQLAPSVESDSLVITGSKGQDELVRLHRWQENPADMVTDLVLRDFRESGLFEKTVDQLSDLRYRYALEGTITNVRGVRNQGKNLALLEFQATLTDFDPPSGGKKNIMTRRYRIEEPSSKSDPEAIVRALNVAVKNLSERLLSDVREALYKTRKGNPTHEQGETRGSPLAHACPWRPLPSAVFFPEWRSRAIRPTAVDVGSCAKHVAAVTTMGVVVCAS
jgi:ABC-type uncharacterized transport system auxiliary subunit